MSGVERLFSELPGPTVINCDWCGAPAVVCSVAERQLGGTPARIGFCDEHHLQILGGADGQDAETARAAYVRRRAEREAELRRQRSAWRQRKAASQASARGRPSGQRDTAPADAASPGRPPREEGPSELDCACPQDSEELVAAILKGERMVSPVHVVDPRLEDPARRLERLQEALWPLVRLAEECGIYSDCNPSQTHSVLIAGEVPIQDLFRARDLLKRER